MTKPIVVVGSINLDLVAATERIPVAGETVLGSRFQTFPGGKGANQAVAAARLGADAAMLGKVGNDSFGKQLKAGLEQAGVNTDAIDFVEGSSGVAEIITDARGNNAITVVPGANAHLEPRDIYARENAIRAAGVVLAQLEIPLETVQAVSDICAEESIPFILDPAPARPLPDTLLRNVSWLTPNETETCSLLGRAFEELGEDALELAAGKLLQCGCRNVILKLGSRGCFVALSDGTRLRLPAYPVRTVDATGAGDAFNGALAVSLVSGKAPLEAAEWATAVAAISVTRHGAQPSMPASSEVERFLAAQPKSAWAVSASANADLVSHHRLPTDSTPGNASVESEKDGVTAAAGSELQPDNPENLPISKAEECS